MRRTLGTALVLASAAAAYAFTVAPAPDPGNMIVGSLLDDQDSEPVGFIGRASSACPAPTSSDGAAVCGLPGRVTLQDRVYFGTFWEGLDENPATRAIALGGGFSIARIERTSEGDFFAGIVEKRDARGQVTDVILAFAGADGLDAVQGEAILLGIPLDEARRATALYDTLLADPRLAKARIHVTGHSLGAGYSQFVLAHAIAVHGAAATQARADFVAFGAPNWIASAAAHFRIDAADVAAQFVDFTSANDPVLLNGVIRMGINVTLPAFTGLPLPYAALNPVAAHEPTTYASALGLPGWLTSAQQAAAMQAISGAFATGNSIDPNYPAPGTAPLVIAGSPHGDWLHGMAGTDILIGGGGADLLAGGGGGDRFVWRAMSEGGGDPATSDRITDFRGDAGDRIDLTALAPPLGRLQFIGTQPFSTSHQLRFRWSSDDAIVEVNLAGDAKPELVIRLTGRQSLQPRDFLLAAPLALF